MSSKSWGEIIDQQDSQNFIGRKQELTLFQSEIVKENSRYLIYYISGQGGVGKTELIKRYREFVEKNKVIAIESDEQQGDIPSILNRFADQLEFQNSPLEKFSTHYKRYKELKQEIESDPNAPLGLASFVGQSIARVGLSLADEVPILRQGVKLIDQDTFSTQAGEWAKYITQKWSNKHDEIALIKDPISILSSLFFDDLNLVASKHQILLCFDNYEITRGYLDSWITRILDYKPSSNIRLAVASRTEAGQAWEKLNNVIAHIKLEVFSLSEANEFLDLAGIDNIQRREEIIELSGRLPVLMSLLVSPGSSEPEPTTPTADIVDRFLKWIQDSSLKYAALDISIPRFFNLDILTALYPNDTQLEIENRFEWLRKQPFVIQRNKGWQYHEVVRRIMMKYWKSRSENRYRSIHKLLANYYLQSRDGLIGESEYWNNEYWQEYSIQYIYHLVMQSPEVYWNSFINFFVLSIKHKISLAQQLIEVFNQPIVLENLNNEQGKSILFFADQLKIIINEERWKGIELYDYLCELDQQDNEAKAHMLFLRGEANRVNDKLDLALRYLDQAINLDPKNYMAVAEKGVIFSIQKKYREALVEFDKALSLFPYHWAYERKGFVLYSINRYDQAIDVLNSALETNENCYETLAFRGACYFEIGELEKALIDLNRALDIEPNDPWSRIRRGETYLKEGNFEIAISDFEMAMKTTSFYEHECLKNIGLALMGQEKYQDATKRFIASLILTPECSHCWTALLTTYENLYPKDEIPLLIGDLQFSEIKFSAKAYLCRAASFARNGYQEAIDDINKALEQEPDIVIPNWIGINDLGLALCKSGKYEKAIECYKLSVNKIDDYQSNYNTAIALALWKGVEYATDQIKKAESSLKLLQEQDQLAQGIAIYGFAGIEAIKNNKNEAFELLRQAIVLNPVTLLFAKETDPAWEVFRADPEFKEITSGQ